MLAERVLLGALMIAALIGIIMLDIWVSVAPAEQAASGQTFMPAAGVPVAIVMATLAALAAHELGNILRRAGYRPAVGWAAFASAGLILIPLLTARANMRFGGALLVDRIQLTPLWIAGSVMGATLAVFARQKVEQAVAHMSCTIFMIIYLGLMGSFATRIRCLDLGAKGAALVLFAVLIIKAGDIGAYLTGRFLGKKPLVPWLSPKKTVEGLLGGIAFAACVAAVAMVAWNSLGGKVVGTPPFGTTHALIFGIIMAIVGHLGDLAESAIKRDAGVKNSGQAIAGFGGLLDVLDSPLFGLPVAWWLLSTFGRPG